eukprot:2349922-Pleurochrysis_carterae.AAC.1
MLAASVTASGGNGGRDGGGLVRGGVDGGAICHESAPLLLVMSVGIPRCSNGALKDLHDARAKHKRTDQCGSMRTKMSIINRNHDEHTL